MNHVFVNSHPIVQDRLTTLRDKKTPSEEFRLCLNDIATFLAMDATQNLPVQSKTIETPLCTMDGHALKNVKPLIVPILRAGLALSEPMQKIIPHADTGHIGLARDHDTHKPVEYLNKLPSDLDRPIFVVDPMLATAGSMLATLDILLAQGATVSDIVIVTLVCAPEGVNNLRDRYPNIPVYTAAIDSHLNDEAYIVPGLGDAGDRFFGTKG